jgi:hypothetical protein
VVLVVERHVALVKGKRCMCLVKTHDVHVPSQEVHVPSQDAWMDSIKSKTCMYLIKAKPPTRHEQKMIASSAISPRDSLPRFFQSSFCRESGGGARGRKRWCGVDVKGGLAARTFLSGRKGSGGGGGGATRDCTSTSTSRSPPLACLSFRLAMLASRGCGPVCFGVESMCLPIQ